MKSRPDKGKYDTAKFAVSYKVRRFCYFQLLVYKSDTKEEE
jgi:hypothetical protein